MNITARPYAGVDDLGKIQTTTARWIGLTGFPGYLHVGDIGLRLYNGMRRYDPGDIVRLWEDTDGTLLGWAMVYPRWNGYEALLHPAQWGGVLEAQILDWSEEKIIGWMQKEGRPEAPITLDVFAEDSARVVALEKWGYTRTDQHNHVIGSGSLHKLIPEHSIPVGYGIRPIEGVRDATSLIEAQNATFGWAWTVEEYSRVMQSPAYQPENVLVVVAPNGQFASFCYLLLDPWNKIGMFEDVGTHPDFQRLGLGRALLCEGMRRMKALGMETALVPYLTVNEPAYRLYTAVGFQILYRHYHYTKTRS